MDWRLKIRLAFPFLLILLGLWAVSTVRFRPSLDPHELRLVTFSAENIPFNERPLFEAHALRSPLEILKKETRQFPPAGLSTVAPPPSENKGEGEKPPELKVSMIVVSADRKLAIVNGLVVKEGDSIAGMKIAKIEKDRILLKERQHERWVKLEGDK